MVTNKTPRFEFTQISKKSTGFPYNTGELKVQAELHHAIERLERKIEENNRKTNRWIGILLVISVAFFVISVY